MNALKSPFLGGLRSLPQSRSASPAPVAPSTLASVDPPPMVPDPPAAALVPSIGAVTGSITPATVAAAGVKDGRGRVLSSLTSFKRSNSPAPPPTAQPPAPTLVQDGSYLQQLGLKLSDAVTKALAQPPVASTVVGEPVVDGKGPIPVGRGKCLGSLISSELRATDGNLNLQRAFVRALQRALSVLLTSLNAQLLPLVSAPGFSVPFSVAATNPFNATQCHALALAAFAGELLETFDVLSLGTLPEASSSSATSANGRGTPLHGDSLRPIREGLESVVNKVAVPLYAQVRKEVGPLLDALEQPQPAVSPPLRPSMSTKSFTTTSAVPVNPSVSTLVQVMPTYSRVLSRLATLSPQVPRALASCLISLHWRAMVALAHRPATLGPLSTPPNTNMPLPQPSSMAAAASKKLFGSVTPPGTPSGSRFLIKLPTSRPPSPPSPASTDPFEQEVKKVYDLLNGLPKPSAGDALEAVEEGLESLDALVNLLRVRGDPSLVPEDVPTLIALPIVLRAAGIPASVPVLTQLGESEYHDGCLSGFGRATECGPLIARSVRDVLNNGDASRAPLLEWLRTRAA